MFDAITQVPPPVNEPAHDFRPGSAERVALDLTPLYGAMEPTVEVKGKALTIPVPAVPFRGTPHPPAPSPTNGGGGGRQDKVQRLAHQPVAIGIGLDDGPDAGARHSLPQGSEVAAQGAEVDRRYRGPAHA